MNRVRENVREVTVSSHWSSHLHKGLCGWRWPEVSVLHVCRRTGYFQETCLFPSLYLSLFSLFVAFSPIPLSLFLSEPRPLPFHLPPLHRLPSSSAPPPSDFLSSTRRSAYPSLPLFNLVLLLPILISPEFSLTILSLS